MWKTGYTDPSIYFRQGKGLIIHSMEGQLQGALSRLDSTSQVSWHYSIPVVGGVIQHYPTEAICWHAGSLYANSRYAGVEMEGRTGEQLSVSQKESLVDLIVWHNCVEAWPGVWHNGYGTAGYNTWNPANSTLLEHNWFSPTDCPSGRIPFEELIMAVATVDELERTLKLVELTLKLQAMALQGKWRELKDTLVFLGV